MTYIPQRLIPNEQKIHQINSCICNKCYLILRYNSELLEGRLDVEEVFDSKIDGSSLNFFPCDMLKLNFDCNKKDVNYLPVDRELARTSFNSDKELGNSGIDINRIPAEYLNKTLVIITKSSIEDIKGIYPFGSANDFGNKTHYNYKLTIVHKPVITNVMHFQISVLSNKDGEYKNIAVGFKKSNNYKELVADVRRKFALLTSKRKVEILLADS